jgi:predicted RNA binding protein YcfA (HicA-like mRNA interferase family)
LSFILGAHFAIRGLVAKLPLVSAKETILVLTKKGYAVEHQTGSHIILRQAWPPYRRLTVPNHKELAKGTLRAILREAGLSVAEFIELLRA